MYLWWETSPLCPTDKLIECFPSLFLFFLNCSSQRPPCQLSSVTGALLGFPVDECRRISFRGLFIQLSLTNQVHLLSIPSKQET